MAIAIPTRKFNNNIHSSNNCKDNKQYLALRVIGHTINTGQAIVNGLIVLCIVHSQQETKNLHILC